MDAANLRGIDLNLLVILDVLLEECHVTRAGQRLALSQSATSNALQRLRELLGDPLLMRTAAGLAATPRAQTLIPILKETLACAARVMLPQASLKSLSRTVRWSIVDHGIALLVPRLLAALRTTAPGVDLVVHPWSGPEAALAQVSDGTLDLAVTVMPPSTGPLRWQRLFSERLVVAMRAGHPALPRFSLDTWLEYPHVVMSARGEATGLLEAVLTKMGKRRRVGVVVPSFLPVLRIVAESDLIALVPVHLLETAPRDELAHREPPLPMPSFEIGVAWHGRRDSDVATMHVVGLLADIVTTKSVRVHDCPMTG
jgi:DNA-binding transcriptional LysR family regulator